MFCYAVGGSDRHIELYAVTVLQCEGIGRVVCDNCLRIINSYISGKSGTGKCYAEGKLLRFVQRVVLLTRYFLCDFESGFGSVGVGKFKLTFCAVFGIFVNYHLIENKLSG